MDITFKTDIGRFNYRVCAVIINDNRLLAMHDERSPYYYLPGGRVMMHETAEDAVIREVKEELDIIAKVIRPLWLNQCFFTEDVDNDKYHELCIYFLVDIEDTSILREGDKFTRTENERTNEFEWLPFERLKHEYLYPLFIKDSIFNLPDTLMLRTENG